MSGPAAKFARLALDRWDGWVALLLTAKFDFGKTRADLFADNRRFAFRLFLVDRIQWFPGQFEGTGRSCLVLVGTGRAAPLPFSKTVLRRARPMSEIPNAEIEAAADALRILWNSEENQRAIKATGHGASWRWQAKLALEAALLVRGRIVSDHPSAIQ